MDKPLILSTLLILTSFSPLSHATSAKLSKHDFLTWPRARADQFGCFLEKSFGYKDKKFNCALHGYSNKGDPCKNTTAWNEGPAFPNKKSKAVHPLIQSIDLSWEHGELQGVSLTLTKKLSEEEANKELKLPKEGTASKPNVMSVSVQQCSTKATCVVIQGFDHMGAGDVDCSEKK